MKEMTYHKCTGYSCTKKIGCELRKINFPEPFTSCRVTPPYNNIRAWVLLNDVCIHLLFHCIKPEVSLLQKLNATSQCCVVMSIHNFHLNSVTSSECQQQWTIHHVLSKGFLVLGKTDIIQPPKSLMDIPLICRFHNILFNSPQQNSDSLPLHWILDVQKPLVLIHAHVQEVSATSDMPGDVIHVLWVADFSDPVSKLFRSPIHKL